MSAFLATLGAAALAWVAGALWYGALAKPWLRVSGIKVGPDGKPLNASPAPFIVSLIAILLVAGMMRHAFAMAGVDTLWVGLRAGFGIGAFFITPWIVLNNTYTGRPLLLSVIDGGYAVLACSILGAVLGLA